MSKENVTTIFDNISTISFNYDRSLEYMLVGGLHSYYAIPEADAEGILEKLRILPDIPRIPDRCETRIVPSGVLSNGKSRTAWAARGQNRQLTAPRH